MKSNDNSTSSSFTSKDIEVYHFSSPTLPLIHHTVSTLTQNELNQYASVPILIDLGSYELRCGYLTDSSPRLVYRNLLARPVKSILISDIFHHVGVDLEQHKSDYFTNLTSCIFEYTLTLNNTEFSIILWFLFCSW